MKQLKDIVTNNAKRKPEFQDGIDKPKRTRIRSGSDANCDEETYDNCSNQDEGESGSAMNETVLTMCDVYKYCEQDTQDDKQRSAECNSKRRYTEHDKEVNFGREAARAIQTAKLQGNTKKCTEFNFHNATQGNQKDRTRELNVKYAPKVTSHWDDLTPRRMVSADNVDILFYLPRFVKETGATLLTEHLIDFGKSQKLSVGTGADGKQRNKAAAFRKTNGAVVGCCILARVWHGIGHSHEAGTISTAFLQSASAYGKSMTLLNDLRFLSVRINAALQKIDVKQSNALSTLVRLAGEKYPHVKALAAIDPLLMEGRAIQFNRQTPLHADRQDPPNGWAFIVVLGKVTKGTMFFPRLNHRIRYISGDAVAVRGRLIQHEVEAWEGDQRISIAHFTHDALWREFDMECP